jgi:hypothetical protein
MHLTPPERRLQRVAAVVNARDLLVRLCDSKRTPRVPFAVRSEARALLRWYPEPLPLRRALEGDEPLQD